MCFYAFCICVIFFVFFFGLRLVDTFAGLHVRHFDKVTVHVAAAAQFHARRRMHRSMTGRQPVFKRALFTTLEALRSRLIFVALFFSGAWNLFPGILTMVQRRMSCFAFWAHWAVHWTHIRGLLTPLITTHEPPSIEY